MDSKHVRPKYIKDSSGRFRGSHPTPTPVDGPLVVKPVQAGGSVAHATDFDSLLADISAAHFDLSDGFHIEDVTALARNGAVAIGAAGILFGASVGVASPAAAATQLNSSGQVVSTAPISGSRSQLEIVPGQRVVVIPKAPKSKTPKACTAAYRNLAKAKASGNRVKIQRWSSAVRKSCNAAVVPGSANAAGTSAAAEVVNNAIASNKPLTLTTAAEKTAALDALDWMPAKDKDSFSRVVTPSTGIYLLNGEEPKVFVSDWKLLPVDGKEILLLEGNTADGTPAFGFIWPGRSSSSVQMHGMYANELPLWIDSFSKGKWVQASDGLRLDTVHDGVRTVR